MIAVIDYDAGNIRNVEKALQFIGCETCVTRDPAVLRQASAAVLPGVGAFGDAMESLTQSHLITPIRDFVASGRPFLGICLGLQLLFAESEESPGVKGLNLLPGKVVRFPSDMGLKIPHIGWNSLHFPKQSPLFAGLPEEAYVYFVHSYYLQCDDTQAVAAIAEYGRPFHAAVAKNNLFATQFHPEKSGETGLAILRNFAKMAQDTSLQKEGRCSCMLSRLSPAWT